MSSTAEIDLSNRSTSMAHQLPGSLGADVERATGATIISVKPRGGGGASREGAEIELRWADGRVERAYMNYDLLHAGAGDDEAFLREAGILRALSAEHAGSGVRTAPFLAALPDSRALLGGFVSGEADFKKLLDEDERMAVAADFMAQLAALHAIDVTAEPVPELGSLASPAAVVRAQIADLRASTLRTGRDPLILLALDWLEANVPSDPERSVVVHGDAGPGNFLYADGRVTALLDWELVHYGDPMADLAMVCLRTLIQPFVPLTAAFKAYEAAGGARVDLDRVRFYRIYFQARFARSASRLFDPTVPPPPVIGTSILYGMLHLRVLSKALAEATGATLAPVSLPSAPPGQRERFFDVALADIKDVIVPRLDQQAAAKAKGLARLVKWWKRVERFGAAYAAEEVAEIRAAIGGDPISVADARYALTQAILDSRVDFAPALQLCHRRIARDTDLLGDSMGAYMDRHFAPIE